MPDTDRLDELWRNAQAGRGACSGCPAHRDTAGEFVSPGLFDPGGEVMFVSGDPSHAPDWDRYGSWAAYNDDVAAAFADSPGGRALARLLEPLPDVALSECWFTHYVKCPVEGDLATDVDVDAAVAHCRTYLEDELAAVDPAVVVTVGTDPAERVLATLFDVETTIKAGTRDCGRTVETDPPVVVSPHWGRGWLDRGDNLAAVQSALVAAYRDEG